MPVTSLPTDPDALHALLDDLAARLGAGEVVVLPTDTVYGLVGLALLPSTHQRLHELKGRPDAMPVAVLVAEVADAFALAESPTPEVVRAARRWWPGPLTLVLDAASSAPILSGDGTLGVRCPDHALVRALARRVGPLAATSANQHGEATVPTAAQAAVVFPDLLVVDGGELEGAASCVVDCTTRPPTILREGPIAAAELLAVLDPSRGDE